METMTREIGNEIWFDQQEAADYIGRSRQGLRDAMIRYEERTKKEIEKIPDGNKVFVKQSDMNELIKLLFPLQALKKGLK